MISAGEVWLDSGSSDAVGSDSGFDDRTSGSAIGATSGSGSDSASGSTSDSASVPLIVSDLTDKDQNENYNSIFISPAITMHVVVLFECDCLQCKLYINFSRGTYSAAVSQDINKRYATCRKMNNLLL